jgi:hypothetical protein
LIWLTQSKNQTAPTRRSGAHWPANSRLALATTTLLARLLVISDPLDVLRQAFLFAHLLETPQHLLRRLVAATLYLNHLKPFSTNSFDIKTTGGKAFRLWRGAKVYPNRDFPQVDAENASDAIGDIVCLAATRSEASFFPKNTPFYAATKRSNFNNILKLS